MLLHIYNIPLNALPGSTIRRHVGASAKKVLGRKRKPEGLGSLRGMPFNVEDNYGLRKRDWRLPIPFSVAPSDIISNLFLEDLEKIWELKKWIPDPCNPYFHYMKPDEPEEDWP